jgi:hypothetical protein
MAKASGKSLNQWAAEVPDKAAHTIDLLLTRKIVSESMMQWPLENSLFVFTPTQHAIFLTNTCYAAKVAKDDK